MPPLQYFGHLMRRVDSLEKTLDAGKDWGQEEKETTEDEMAGWHHGLDERESDWTPGVGDGQGGLACCDSWGRKESDTTEWLNWTDRGNYLNNRTAMQRIVIHNFNCLNCVAQNPGVYHLTWIRSLQIFCLNFIDADEDWYIIVSSHSWLKLFTVSSHPWLKLFVFIKHNLMGLF